MKQYRRTKEDGIIGGALLWRRTMKMINARAIGAHSDNRVSTTSSICCHFFDFGSRHANTKCLLPCLHRVPTTSALGGAKVDMSTIQTNYNRLSECQTIIVDMPIQTRTKLALNSSVRRKARWRHFSNKFIAQRKTTLSSVEYNTVRRKGSSRA